ncbi:MAG TPA: ABC transporter permease subunit [Acidimicrobiales bacterium]
MTDTVPSLAPAGRASPAAPASTSPPVPAGPGTPPAGAPAPTRRGRPRRLGPGRRRPCARLAGPVAVLAVWAALSAAERLDTRVVPAPWTVVETGWDLWSRGSLGQDIVTSASRAWWGFVVGLAIGVALAIPAGLSRVGEALIDGTAQVKRSIPSLGLIPLFILWLGIGESFKIAIIAIGVFFPVYLNLHSGLANIDSRYVELAETLRVSRAYFVRHVVIPGSLPSFFVGLRLAVTGSWLSLVVLEQINATSGLGYMMFQAQNYGQTEVIFVGLVVYGVLGFASDAAVRAIERRVLSWRRTLAS